MANVQFKKGDQVWVIGDWNQKGTFYFQKLTVQSWGAKTATASTMVDGRMLKVQIYTNQVNDVPYRDHYFLATEEFDVEAKALELAAAFIAWSLEQAKSKIGHPGYVQSVAQAKIEFFSSAKPSVIARA